MPVTAAQRVINIDTLVDNIIARGGEYTINGRTWRNIDLKSLREERDYWQKQAESDSGRKRGSVGFFGSNG